MKKTLSIILVVGMLALVIGSFGTVSAAPGEQNGDSLSIVQPSGGAYIHVTELVPGQLNFKYGWNNVNSFDASPVGYWIGVYDVTASTYVGPWPTENPFTEPAPKLLKLQSLDETPLISGHDYYINFFVRSDYGTTPYTNIAVIVLEFTAP